MKNKIECSCMLCRNVITTNQLPIHYGSKQCASGKLFSQARKRNLGDSLICQHCGEVKKTLNAISQHETLCKLNPSRKYKKPSYGMLGKKDGTASNQFIKAKSLGLPMPVVSEKTRQLIRDSNSINPRASYASQESQRIIKKILSLISYEGQAYYHDNGREYFLKDNDIFCFYDLVLLDIKYIVEYQGIAFHPKTLSEDFRVPYASMGTKEDIWRRDRDKENLALRNGFKIRYIWSDTTDEDVRVIVDEINNIIQNSRQTQII